jgi:hypothetical protein
MFAFSSSDDENEKLAEMKPSGCGTPAQGRSAF